MATPLFDRTNCSIESVPALDFDFVTDCFIPPVPQVILDCAEPDIPVEPLDADGCPSLRATGELAVGFGLTPNVDIIVTEVPPGEGCADALECEYVFDFDFEIPLGCPTLDATGTVTLEVGAEPAVDVTVTRVGDETTCEYLFDFAIILPDETGYTGPRDVVTDVYCDAESGLVVTVETWFFENGRLQE